VSIVRIVLGFCFGLWAATTLAQDVSPPGVPSRFQPSELCTVEGQVVKATTGEPLRKITVQLQPLNGPRRFGLGQAPQAFSTITDSSGHFLLNGVDPGRYVLTAGGGGYPDQVYGQDRLHGQMKPLEVNSGHPVRDILMRLQPPGVITGTIYDEDGDPVVGAQVQALRSFRQGNRRQISGASPTQTDDRGEYRIFGLESGDYLIVANYQPRQTLPAKLHEDVYLPTFHPGTSDPGQAILVQVHPGDEESGINVELKRAHGVGVSGRVLSEAPARTLQGTYVSLVPRNSTLPNYNYSNYGTGVQDQLGNFQIPGVPPGSYFLSASRGDQHGSYFGRTAVEVGTVDVEGVTVFLGPGIELHGRFRTDPPAKLNISSLNLYLSPADSPMGGGSAEVKPDGTFVIRNLCDGTYRVHVGGFPEEYYVKSARLGGLDVFEAGLSITHGQSPSQLEITLTQDGGQVNGTVLKDQKPLEGAFVVLVPDPPLRSHEELYSFKRSDPLGKYSLLGLPPGDFKLFAWEQIEEGADVWDPDYIKQYDDRGTRVHIEEKQQQDVQLEVIPLNEDSQP